MSFALTNGGDEPLYLKGDPGSGGPEFQLLVSGEPVAAAEAKFCPNWCPERGAVMELDCAKPDPAMIALPPGGAIEVRWSGEMALDYAKSCRDGQARHCLQKQPAPAGHYRASFCAWPSYSGAEAGASPGNAGKIVPATPAGESVCIDAPFSAPTGAVVAVRFN